MKKTLHSAVQCYKRRQFCVPGTVPVMASNYNYFKIAEAEDPSGAKNRKFSGVRFGNFHSYEDTTPMKPSNLGV